MKFIIIFLLTPFLALGLTFKDGKQVDNNNTDNQTEVIDESSKDVFLLRNAGLSSKDTTLNIPGGMELNSKNHERYSTYKNIMKNIDYNILSVINDETRFGETALVFRVGKDCIGIKEDCQRGEPNGGNYTRAEFSPINYFGKHKDNSWTSYSFKIVSDPEEWSPYSHVSLQQWNTNHADMPIMFMALIRKEIGLVLRIEASKGVKVVKDDNPYCSAGKYCVNRELELLALEWNEIKKGEWIDVIQNINFDDDPEKGYAKVWINGNLIIDYKGSTSWNKPPSIPIENMGWIYTTGIYTKYTGHEMAVAYDEVSVARSCEKLKIENLGYDCNELIKQSAPKAFAVVDVEWIHSNGERDTKSDKSLIHIDKSKYTSIASGENFEDGNYELMWYWLQIDDEGNLVQDQYLGMDQVIIENGFLTFAKKNLSMEYFIQWKNRKDIYFKTEDGLILISANLDLSSDGETESIEIVGPTSTDIDGNYYAEGFWGDSSTEGIGMKFKPISN